MKRIIITEKQLNNFVKMNETVQQYVNKKPGETLDAAIKTAAREVAIDAPNADVDFVVPKDEVNENIDTSSNNIVNDVTTFIINKWGDEFEDGHLSLSEVDNMIQDAYIEVTGQEIDYNDKSIYRQIHYKLIEYVMSNKNRLANESVVITKKQIKEAQKNKRITESKVITKSDFMKSLN